MTDLPKQDLLVKLLKMTSSSNDGEALTAMRKANALIASAGWDWDRIMSGKITIVEDPFNKSDPFAGMFNGNATKPVASTPSRAPTQSYSPPPQPKPTPVNKPFVASVNSTIGLGSNKFVGFCYCCGIEVPAQAGRFFRPSALNPAAPDKFHVVCHSCNTTGIVYANPTGQRLRARGKSNISDLV